MAIKVGDKLPEGTLTEFVETERPGCTVGPNAFAGRAISTKGKKIVIFGLPGAFTPTCSAKHVPSYVQNFDKLKAKGVDEVWCVSVNDAFVMGAWGKEQKCDGKVRMMADGSATFTKALGLEHGSHRPRHGRALASATRCWSTTASSRPLNVEAARASSRSATPTRC